MSRRRTRHKRQRANNRKGTRLERPGRNEFAAELTTPRQAIDPPLIGEKGGKRNPVRDFLANGSRSADRQVRWVGWAALAIALLSLFVWPLALGPVAAVAGAVAFWLGNRGLGIWSVVLGIISFFTALLLVPLYG